MSDQARYEFATAAWLDSVHRILAELVETHQGELRGVTYKASELFTNCPPDGSDFAWWFNIDDGVLTFGEGRLENPDVDIVVPYEVVLPRARSNYGDGVPAAHVEAREKGLYEMRGSVSDHPPVIGQLLTELHNASALRTA